MKDTNHFKPFTINDPAKQINSQTAKRKNNQLDTVSMGIMHICCSISGCSNNVGKILFHVEYSKELNPSKT